MHDVAASRRPMLGSVLPAIVLLALVTAMSVAYTLAIAAFAAVVRPTPPSDLVLTAEAAAERAGPAWFHGRPTAPPGGVSGGSNLGPTNPALAAAVAGREAAVRAENPTQRGPVPIDLVTESGSGFDPHISPAAARLQVARVAAAHGLAESAVNELVDRAIEPPTFGLFGHPRVNVGRLNAALGVLAAPQPPATAATQP